MENASEKTRPQIPMWLINTYAQEVMYCDHEAFTDLLADAYIVDVPAQPNDIWDADGYAGQDGWLEEEYHIECSDRDMHQMADEFVKFYDPHEFVADTFSDEEIRVIENIYEQLASKYNMDAKSVSHAIAFQTAKYLMEEKLYSRIGRLRDGFIKIIKEANALRNDEYGW